MFGRQADQTAGTGRATFSRRWIAKIGAGGLAGILASTGRGWSDNSGTDRLSRGFDILRRIGGENFDGPVKSLAETSPDLSRFTVEYPYGDVLSRPGLDLRLRQLCTVAMLLADGSARPQLKFHLAGYLNVGGEPGHLIELMFVSAALLGFPSSIHGIGILRELFAERAIVVEPTRAADADGRARWDKGLSALEALTGNDVADYFKGVSAASPDLARLTVAFAFGDALGRDGLDQKEKLLAIIAMLAARGNRAAALRIHLAGALAHGVSRDEIIEVLIQLSVYRGFPAALNAFSVARDVFAAPQAVTRADIAEPAGEQSSAERLKNGGALLAATSATAGNDVVRSFDDIAPDLGRMIVAHSYGEIFSRPGLDSKSRELSACAALAATGSTTTETPLRVHINAALNVGARRGEVVETLVNLLPYCGYPAVHRAVSIAAEEFAKRPG